jgi:hypothetical protein
MIPLALLLQNPPNPPVTSPRERIVRRNLTFVISERMLTFSTVSAVWEVALPREIAGRPEDNPCVINNRSSP